MEFYHQHIEKEDKWFFPETERHYSKQEHDDMIASFYSFDRQMIHDKYKDVVETLRRSS